MNRVKELKRTLGNEYVYQRFMSDREVSCLRRQAPQYLEDMVAASLKEQDMLAVLDRIVAENGLSYTECCFERLEGRQIKPYEKIQESGK